MVDIFPVRACSCCAKVSVAASTFSSVPILARITFNSLNVRCQGSSGAELKGSLPVCCCGGEVAPCGRCIGEVECLFPLLSPTSADAWVLAGLSFDISKLSIGDDSSPVEIDTFSCELLSMKVKDKSLTSSGGPECWLVCGDLLLFCWYEGRPSSRGESVRQRQAKWVFAPRELLFAAPFSCSCFSSSF